MTLKKHGIVGHLTVAIKYGDTNAFPPALGEAVQAFRVEKLIDATGYARHKIGRATRPEASQGSKQPTLWCAA